MYSTLELRFFSLTPSFHHMVRLFIVVVVVIVSASSLASQGNVCHVSLVFTTCHKVIFEDERSTSVTLIMSNDGSPLALNPLCFGRLFVLHRLL